MTDLKKLRAKERKLHAEALPFLMFLLGLVTSAILSEAVTIFHELLREWAGENYPNVRVAVFFGCLILLGYVYYLVHKDYIKPLAKVDNDLKEPKNSKE